MLPYTSVELRHSVLLELDSGRRKARPQCDACCDERLLLGSAAWRATAYVVWPSCAAVLSKPCEDPATSPPDVHNSPQQPAGEACTLSNSSCTSFAASLVPTCCRAERRAAMDVVGEPECMCMCAYVHVCWMGRVIVYRW